MSDRQKLLSTMESDLLNCPVCMDYADQAVETVCCGNVFCEGCLSASGPNCPMCRHQNVSSRPSMLARRAIAALPTNCPFLCGDKLTKGDIKHHIMLCKNRQFTCPAVGCGFIGKKDMIGPHVLQCHQDEFIKNMNLLFNPPTPELRRPGSDGDPIATTTNDKGGNCRLGETGKYYCGGLGCSVAFCCDGQCGPTNGCNCASCQRLDMKVRNVPKGFLVNRQGALCRLGTTGRFYCGRRVMRGVANCDGYCGPTNGPQCSSCKVIQQQTRPGYLYGDLWTEVNESSH